MQSDRRLLCEGWIDECCEPGEGGVFYPTLAYCVQPGKVFVARGTLDESRLQSLTESAQGSLSLVSLYEQLDLEERRISDGSTAKLPKNGRWVVEGPFQRSDTPNANRRRYPRAIWDRLVADEKSYVQETVRARGMVGHVEHPAGGRTDGLKGALVVTNLKLNGDGVVWGDAELLDTPGGLVLQEYSRKGVRWGLSSRGNGAVSHDGVVDPDKFVLETWDAVMKPSVPGAYPVLSAASKKNESVIEPTTYTAETRVEITEQAKALDADVSTLLQVTTEGFDRARRNAHVVKLFEALERSSALLSTGKIQQDRVIELQRSLMQAAREQLTVDESDIDRVIQEAFDDEESSRGGSKGFDLVLESLRQRLQDSVTESADLRERLEAAESRLVALQQQYDESVGQLSEAEGTLTATQAQLNLAEDLLATQPSTQANRLVVAAVNDVVARVPKLSEFSDVLLRSQTAEEVQALAERLLPVVIRRVPDVPEPRTRSVSAITEVTRASLPVGLVCSDDAGVMAPAVKSVTELSEGARKAAQMVASQPR